MQLTHKYVNILNMSIYFITKIVVVVVGLFYSYKNCELIDMKESLYALFVTNES